MANESCGACWIGWAREPKSNWRAALEIHVHVSRSQAEEAFEPVKKWLGECVSTILLPADQSPGKKPK
jgi:hypothetical protein